MKKLIFAALTLIILTLISNIASAEEEMVPEGYFPENRVVDARECVQFIFERDIDAFLFCLNVDNICKHEVTKKPIGEVYGYKITLPAKKPDGDLEWVDVIWKTKLTDTESRQWCIDFKLKNGKKTII